MTVAVLWFRKSLRLHDNEALTWACSSDEVDSILPIYIFDEGEIDGGGEALGFNRIKFTEQALKDLDSGLRKELGICLKIFSGDYQEVLKKIVTGIGGERVCLAYEYCSEPRIRDAEDALKDWFDISESFRTISFPARHTLLDIEEVVGSKDYKKPNSMKDMERIFRRHFGVNSMGFYEVGGPLPVPNNSKPLADAYSSVSGLEISDLERIIMETYPERSDNTQYFPGGETEALERLRNKVTDRRQFVNEFRKPNTMSTNSEDDPREPSTTGLSAYLSSGCLSIRMLWRECENSYLRGSHTKPPESLHGQMMFREMFYLLSRSVENWDSDVGNDSCIEVAWDDFDREKIMAWETGSTGYPYIDAMMRQLDETGWMHHLGRHAVSCFLTRGQLWQNWTHGRDVFERKLVDSDWALNNGNWLWLAGVAPFSMPYYRIYNPCPDSKSSLNVETVNAEFIRYWVPELRSFPSKYIFEPHLAPISIQESAGCMIGDDYPLPIVDRKQSRKENLIRFKASREK